MFFEVYSLCHRGIVRPKNQDNFICFNTLADTQNSNFRHSGVYSTNSPSLFGVFDGMGGHLCGERASEIAVNTAKEMFVNYKGGNPQELLGDICHRSNAIICDEMTNVVKGRMGTTAAMVLFENDRFYLCNLGDSPVFLIKDNGINLISYEHSERENYEKIFGKNYDKKKKFRLTQNLGIFPDEMEIFPYFTNGPISEDDIFLLCSDGLTDMVELDEILNIVTESESVESAGEKLLSVALANGGKDNITIIIGKVTDKKENIETDAEKSKNVKNKKMIPVILSVLSALIVTALIFTIMLFVVGRDNRKQETTISTAVSTADEIASIDEATTVQI